MTDDGAKRLAAAVIYQAVDDWHKNPKLRPEISRFLNSDWGNMLLPSVAKFDAKTVRNRIDAIEIPNRRDW